MVEHEYSQGIMGDGAAILKDGQPMTIEEIVAELRSNQKAVFDQAQVNRMIPKGDSSLAGDFVDEEGNAFCRAIVVEFPTVEDFRAAMKAGQCRFTVFGGEA